MPKAESITFEGRSLNLFVGRSGAGKTAAALSYPHPIKVLDTDGRIRGGLTPWIEKKGIEYIPILNRGKKSVYEQLNDEFELIETFCRSNQNQFQTLVLDSATWQAAGLLLDAIPLTHEKGKGKVIGSMNMAGPAEYGFQSTGMLSSMAFLRSLPIPNIIVTAHIVARYGRKKNADGEIVDPYGPTEIIGEALALTDKLSESLPSSFDNVFKFEKIDTGRASKYIFEADGELARNWYGIKYGPIDITGKDFYKTLMEKAGIKPTDVSLVK